MEDSPNKNNNRTSTNVEELNAELKKKKERLAELIKARSKATCSSTYSSKSDVDRESEIEDLEEEIKVLESKL